MTRKESLALIIPGIISAIIEPIIALTDASIAGHIPLGSSIALAAIGLSGTVFSTIIWSVGQLRSAVSSTVARYLGMKKLDEIKTTIPQVLLFSFFLGLLFFGISTLFSRYIFHLYSTENAVLESTIIYFNIRSFGFPFIFMSIVFFGVFRGMQNTSWSMYVGLSGAIINIILSYLLVYMIGENPDYLYTSKMVAIGSVLSEIIMFLYCIWFYCKKTPFRFNFFTSIHKEVYAILFIVVNLVIRTIALNFVIHFCNYLATSLGTIIIATQSILINIWLFSAFFIDGITSVVNIISGKLLGQKDYPGIILLVRKNVRLSINASLVIAFVFLVLYIPIGKLFSNNQDLLHAFYDSFWFIIVIQPIAAFAYAYDALFKGIGKAKILRDILLVSSFVVFTTFIGVFYFWLEWGVVSIWVSFAFWLLARGILGHMHFQRWIKNQLALNG